MQKHSIFSFFIIILTLTFISCDPCNNFDCITSNYFGQFRIVNKTDGKDLVFGTNSIYDKTNIKFYSLNGTDTTFFEYAPIKFSSNGYDSILNVKFYPETRTPVYMKLNDFDVDTLVLTYNSYETKCCGTITEITKYRYNNIIDISGVNGTQEIKK